MKPSFALTLSFEGIGLLHRSGSGWNRVGEVPLDVPDLTQALSLLKKTAEELTSEPLQAKLVLPAEQIKYLRLSDPKGGRDVQEAAVRAALDGATPYTLDELAFDWAESGGELTVAAVARETLREAESFARDNGFTPVYFAALPALGEYKGEPHFGDCADAADLGPIEHDGEAVRISGVARMPEPEKPEATSSETTAEEPEVTVSQVSSEEPEATPAPAEPITDSAAEAPPAPSFASRRSESSGGVAPSLSGVTRHEPRAVAPSIPVGDSGAAVTPQPPAPPMPKPAPAESGERGVMSFFSRRSGDDPAPTPRPILRPKAESSPPLPAPPPSILPPTQSEKQRLTVFGARKPEKEPLQRVVAGKPRFLGLILTAVLLVFLLGVAAWASIFSGEGLSRFLGKERTDVAARLPEVDELEIEGEEAMLPENPLELASLGGAEEKIDTDAAQPAPQLAEPMSQQEAQEKYAVTGIWVLPPEAPAPPPLLGDDDLYIASIDSAIDAQDAIALPPLSLEQADGGLGQQADPAAQGQRFALDARGLVIATREGSISPDGHMVFAGKPPYFPSDLPDRSEPPEVIAAGPDPLASVRPKARPEGLQVANERATLGGRSLSELAALRPKLRPPSATEIASAAVPIPVPKAEASEELEAAIEEAVAAAVPPTAGAVVIRLPEANARDLDPNATPQAVARSVKPKDRPRNFDRIVKRAERAQENTEEEEEVTQVAAVAPRTVAPSIPSRSSVAKQATVRNAINLRRVNLIGVYGKPNSRRALVRLSNGRYKKVAVGDRIDGGRVSAIGDTELRYQKNGRDVTLKMPKG